MIDLTKSTWDNLAISDLTVIDDTSIMLDHNALDVFIIKKIAHGDWSVLYKSNVFGHLWIGVKEKISRKDIHGQRRSWSDPLLALGEAEKWYRENVENKKD